MTKTHYGICSICEAICGLQIEHDGKNIISISGDKHDNFSRGYICPKGIALQDLHNDPDRLRLPVRRKGSGWEEVSWADAFEEAGGRIAEIQKKYGNDAVAVYYGNPIAHNYSSILAFLPFIKGFKTRNVYSANSVDSLTRVLVSLLVYGNQALLPIPDIERTELFMIIGANPVISNGSVMAVPDCERRLMEIRERGGKLIVIDPRYTETAAIADAHYFIRPGTDALFLLAMLNVMFEEEIADPDKLSPIIDGLDRLKKIVAEYPPERVADTVGIPSGDIKTLARDFSSSSKAICYGRLGTSTQEFGSLATWLVDAVNIVTGNLDRPGGMMFTTPAVDLAGLAKLFRQPGTFNRWQSRVSGLPEFNGEFPVAALAEEIETPGPGQIKALVTNSGNPILSLPNGRRLDRAFGMLEFIVSIDFYINETTRHADIILPSTSPMEIDHYPLLEHMVGIRNTAHYTPASFPKPEGSRHNWEIQLDLIHHIERNRGAMSSGLGGLKRSALNLFSPQRQLNLLLKLGPHKLSIKKLKQFPHGVDLGPLVPRINEVINTPNRRINLVPEVLAGDLERLEKKLDPEESLGEGKFLLISRRTLRSMNSWLHNIPRLVKGKNRCTLMMNSKDADRRGFETGQHVIVTSRVGKIRAPLEVTDEMMPGVVSLTFGWGHDREGSMLSVAREHAGVSMNDITDEYLYDKVSGISVLDGIPVTVSEG
ncbi:MAG: molybdopterin-dependent oxidoreductase [Deltaproteobacteria bacterium]|nr:MAG: molybdopterin-dependent oxidoreductase [Deltaproteobacteria bacterium]